MRFTTCSLAIITVFAAATARADTLSCDMTQYKATQGLTASAAADALTVTWAGAEGSELRMRLAIDNGAPIVRELAVQRRGGQWAALGRNLRPEFRVTSGRRRVGTDQLNTYRELGIPLTKELLEREKWNAFWDSPLMVPGRPGTNMDLPRKPEEIRKVWASYHATGCQVTTDGARIEVA